MTDTCLLSRVLKCFFFSERKAEYIKDLVEAQGKPAASLMIADWKETSGRRNVYTLRSKSKAIGLGLKKVVQR